MWYNVLVKTTRAKGDSTVIGNDVMEMIRMEDISVCRTTICSIESIGIIERKVITILPSCSMLNLNGMAGESASGRCSSSLMR